ncbi:MAG: HAD-IIB family hydrolase [Lachnotalea sp.]
MKTLYVTDLDGTLLNTYDTINKFSRDVINSLVEKDMLFTYATARSLVSASMVTAGLTLNRPVITYNGAFIIHPQTKEILSCVAFSKDETNNVIHALQKCKISPLVYSHVDDVEQVSWVTTKENDGMKRYLTLRKGDKRLRPLENEEGLMDGKIFYYTCIGTKQELLPIYEIFSQDERYTCTLQQELYRPEYWCEIMPRKATKAEAILTLKKLWKCEKIVSFGDAINDIPMFRISDECYAVENAVDALKNMATGIIESNEQEGVAKWLKENAKY